MRLKQAEANKKREEEEANKAASSQQKGISKQKIESGPIIQPQDSGKQKKPK